MSVKELEARRRSLFMFDRDFIKAYWTLAGLQVYAASCQAWEEHVEELLIKSFSVGSDAQIVRVARAELEALFQLLMPLSVEFYDRSEKEALDAWERDSASSGKGPIAHLSGGYRRKLEATGEVFFSSWSVAGLDTNSS